MKKIVLTSLMMVCLPFLAVAQKRRRRPLFHPEKESRKEGRG